MYVFELFILYISKLIILIFLSSKYNNNACVIHHIISVNILSCNACMGYENRQEFFFENQQYILIEKLSSFKVNIVLYLNIIICYI